MQQTLKFLVIFMGILIIAGIAIIGVTIANRATSTADSAPAAAASAFGSIALGLPQGSTVIGTEATDTRLILTVQLPGGGERVIVLDIATGAQLGTVDVTGAR